MRFYEVHKRNSITVYDTAAEALNDARKNGGAVYHIQIITRPDGHSFRKQAKIIEYKEV